jgi:uncharacterized membrane protein
LDLFLRGHSRATA